MAKESPLMKGLNRKRAKKKTDATRTAEAIGYRTGRVLVAGHFATEVQKTLKIMAATEETTVQALLSEAINMLFAKRGKPEIASAGPPPAPVEEGVAN